MRSPGPSWPGSPGRSCGEGGEGIGRTRGAPWGPGGSGCLRDASRATPDDRKGPYRCQTPGRFRTFHHALGPPPRRRGGPGTGRDPGPGPGPGPPPGAGIPACPPLPPGGDAGRGAASHRRLDLLDRPGGPRPRGPPPGGPGAGVTALPDESALVLSLQRIRGKDEGVELVVEFTGNRWNALVVGVESRQIRHVLLPREEQTRSLTVGAPYLPPPRNGPRGASLPGVVDGAAGGRDRGTLLRTVACTSSLNAPLFLEGGGEAEQEGGPEAGEPEAASRRGDRMGSRSPGVGEDGFLRWQTGWGTRRPGAPRSWKTDRGPQPYPISVAGDGGGGRSETSWRPSAAPASGTRGLGHPGRRTGPGRPPGPGERPGWSGSGAGWRGWSGSWRGPGSGTGPEPGRPDPGPIRGDPPGGRRRHPHRLPRERGGGGVGPTLPPTRTRSATTTRRADGAGPGGDPP
jgi:hypothetical protein